MRPAASAYVRSPETWAFQKVLLLARAKREGWTREIQNAKALVKREAHDCSLQSSAENVTSNFGL